MRSRHFECGNFGFDVRDSKSNVMQPLAVVAQMLGMRRLALEDLYELDFDWAVVVGGDLELAVCLLAPKEHVVHGRFADFEGAVESFVNGEGR